MCFLKYMCQSFRMKRVYSTYLEKYIFQYFVYHIFGVNGHKTTIFQYSCNRPYLDLHTTFQYQYNWTYSTVQGSYDNFYPRSFRKCIGYAT